MAAWTVAERSRSAKRFQGRRRVQGGIGEVGERLGLLLPLQIDDQVAGDGEEPGFEAGPAVVKVAAVEHADPGLLEDVLGGLAGAGEV